MMEAKPAADHGPVPRVRSPGVDLDAPVPRYWFGNNAFATHVANGVNLLFPAGERFFVRSVNHYLDRIESPLLRAQIKGFFGQEGRHAKEHERVFRILEAQGYDVRRFLRFYERVAYGFIEKVSPPSLRLATTAACEHFTAIMAEHALRDGLISQADPTMQQLLLWHASEEIEHRAVAFDVLNEVAPGYGLRVAGLAMATLCLGGFWAIGAAMLILQDEHIDRDRMLADWRIARERRKVSDVFARGIREYLRPGFHPSQSDIDGLASSYLASVGLS
ncbi:MAG: metal-dependent hydrolase [Minicystis sp.]